MSREATITQEQVNAAADAIRASGAKPTARGIRDQLGTGSMATVLKFLQVRQSGQVKPAAQDVILPLALTRALVDFIGQEVAQARAGLEAELATAQQSQADLIGESERQAAMIEAQGEALDLAHAEKAELQGKLGLMETDLATVRDEAARERQTAEAARTDLAKAQLRLEALPRIEVEADRLRGELDAERRARAEAEQKAAVLASKVEYETGLRQKAEADLVEQAKAAEEAHKRALASAEALGNARVTVQATTARLEAAARELRDTRKEADAARAEAKMAGEEAAELRGELAAVAGYGREAKPQPAGSAGGKPNSTVKR
ncbi:MAG: DNA-binding protein [Sulfuricella sp.]|nr:DNA-binding protein [Sulfuricella sp.]